jgi:4-hydroxy-tetrahydrodipicolinate synthase
MKNALFAGVNAAVLTPMRDDLSPDLDRLAERCRWLLANGTDGLAVLGTTGEGNSLGVQEKLDLLDGLKQRRLPTEKLLPGVGTTAITDTVKLIRGAEQIGCRGVLVLPPFYYKKPSEDGLFAYFSEVINRAGTGIHIYLYHIPANPRFPSPSPWSGACGGRFPVSSRASRTAAAILPTPSAMSSISQRMASRSIAAMTAR